MSYMRWPVYVWDDGWSMHLWLRGDLPATEKCYPLDLDGYSPEFVSGLSMPLDLFDQLVIARYAELKPSRIKRIVKKLQSKKSPVNGNFGSYAFLEAIGEDPVAEFKKAMQAAVPVGGGDEGGCE